MRILIGDCRVRLVELADASIDSVVTDPPYHLTTGKKGGTGEASVNLESPYGRARVTTGFMGLQWDGGDIAMRPELWAEVLRVLKPGGHLLAFGGTRTHHRVWCAIEDAGFEVRDTLGWLYGSGFPKSHNGEWGSTALKPAWEPIILARKPLLGTVEANWREHGTGAMNIDACRISTKGEELREGSGAIPCRHDETESRKVGKAGWGGPMKRLCAAPGQEGKLVPRSEPHDGGRWPANIIHDGSDEVLDVFPQTESGKQSENGHIRNSDKTRHTFGAFAGQRCEGDVLYGDAGSAARFFYCAKPTAAERELGMQGRTKKLFGMSGAAAAAAARGEQYDNGDGGVNQNKLRANNHPTVKPIELMRYLCRLVTPPGGLVLDPFMGSGTTGIAALREGFSFVGVEREPEYAEIARARIKADAPLFDQVEVA